MDIFSYLARRKELSVRMWTLRQRARAQRGESCFSPDARGWIGIGVWAMSGALLLMMYLDPGFREDEFIQTIATLVIGTGFVGGAVSWAYSSTKSGNELAQSSARIAEQAATANTQTPTGTPENPVSVAGAAPGAAPVTTTEA